MKKRFFFLLLALALSFSASSQTLVQAFNNNNYDEFKKLLNSGTDLYQLYNGESVVGCVIRRDDPEIIDYVVNHPKFKVDKMYPTKHCGAGGCTFILQTAIYTAINNYNYDLVKTLLSKGPNVDYKVIVYAIEDGVRVDMQDRYLLADAFSIAPDDTSLEIARQIAERVKIFNLVINTHDNEKNTIPLIAFLIQAIEDRAAYNPIFTDLFLRSGVDINYVIPFNPNLDAYMKKIGLNQKQINYTKSYGFFRLVDEAVKCNNLELVQWFLDRGAKLEKTGDKCASVLYIAPSIAMVKLLVENGVDINTTLPESKFNILQRWIKEADPKDFEELLKMGANPNHKDAMGLSVQEHVMQGGFVPKNVKKNLKLLETYQAANKN